MAEHPRHTLLDQTIPLLREGYRFLGNRRERYGSGVYEIRVLGRRAICLVGARLALLDPNPDVLRFASQRLRRYRPALHTADARAPVDLPPASFQSVGLSYVLHCLPGEIGAKAVVFDHLAPLIAPGGVLFGSTILARGVRRARVGRALLRVYNRNGIFGNLQDDLAGLEGALAARFERYEVRVVGAVGLFAATVS